MFENYSKHGMVLIIFLDLPNPIAFMAKRKKDWNILKKTS